MARFLLLQGRYSLVICLPLIAAALSISFGLPLAVAASSREPGSRQGSPRRISITLRSALGSKVLARSLSPRTRRGRGFAPRAAWMLYFLSPTARNERR